MTDKEIKNQIKIIKKVGKEICKSKKKARKFLKDLGFGDHLTKIKPASCSICFRELPNLNKNLKTKNGCVWCDPKGEK